MHHLRIGLGKFGQPISQSSYFDFLQDSLAGFLLGNLALQGQIAPSDFIEMLPFDLCSIILVCRREVVLNERKRPKFPS
jgi:hypothetical protein